MTTLTALPPLTGRRQVLPGRLQPAVRRTQEWWEYYAVSVPLIAVNLLYRQHTDGSRGRLSARWSAARMASAQSR